MSIANLLPELIQCIFDQSSFVSQAQLLRANEYIYAICGPKYDAGKFNHVIDYIRTKLMNHTWTISKYEYIVHLSDPFNIDPFHITPILRKFAMIYHHLVDCIVPITDQLFRMAAYSNNINMVLRYCDFMDDSTILNSAIDAISRDNLTMFLEIESRVTIYNQDDVLAECATACNNKQLFEYIIDQYGSTHQALVVAIERDKIDYFKYMVANDGIIHEDIYYLVEQNRFDLIEWIHSQYPDLVLISMVWIETGAIGIETIEKERVSEWLSSKRAYTI